MRTRFLIILGIAVTLTTVFFVLGPSQGHVAEYFLTDEQFEEMILGDTSHVNDFRDTENPNECWYQDDDGKIKPCVIETDGWPSSFSPWPEQNCDEICQESKIEHAEMSGMSWISYGHQWILTILLMIVILIAIPVGIIFGVKIWRKRK